MNSICPTVIQNLFSFGLEEIIQKIFLNLDPKSLKNAKLTCTQWREFIDRRIWGSKYARGMLFDELILNWKSLSSLSLENDLEDEGGPVRKYEIGLWREPRNKKTYLGKPSKTRRSIERLRQI